MYWDNLLPRPDSACGRFGALLMRLGLPAIIVAVLVGLFPRSLSLIDPLGLLDPLFVLAQLLGPLLIIGGVMLLSIGYMRSAASGE